MAHHNNIEQVIEQTSGVATGKFLAGTGSVVSVSTALGFNELELKAIGIFSGMVIGIIGLIITYYFQQKNYKLNEQKALKSNEWDGIERRVSNESSKDDIPNSHKPNFSINSRRQSDSKRR